jgi:hypothetical protein
MKVHIDFSISTIHGEAIGYVNGQIDCMTEPMIGDTICFMLSADGTPIPQGHEAGGLLQVTGRTIRPNKNDSSLSLSLSNLVVETKDQALKIMDYFESRFGLFSNIYNEDD